MLVPIGSWIIVMLALYASWSDSTVVRPVRKVLRIGIFVGLQVLLISYLLRISLQFTADTYLLQSSCKCIVTAIDRHQSEQVAGAITAYMTNPVPKGVNASISAMLSTLHDHVAPWNVPAGDFTRSTPLHAGHPGDILQQMRSDDSPTNPPADGKR